MSKDDLSRERSHILVLASRSQSPAPASCDGVPELVDEDTTAPIPAAELERQRDVERPVRSQRPTLEMPPEAIETLRLVSIKLTEDLQRMESSVRRDRKPQMESGVRRDRKPQK